MDPWVLARIPVQVNVGYVVQFGQLDADHLVILDLFILTIINLIFLVHTLGFIGRVDLDFHVHWRFIQLFGSLVAHESLVCHSVVKLRTWIQDVNRLLFRSAIKASQHVLLDLLEKLRFFYAASHYFYESRSVIGNGKWCDGLVIICDNFRVLFFRERLLTKTVSFALIEFAAWKWSLLHDWLSQLVNHPVTRIELVIVRITKLWLIYLTLSQLLLIGLLKKLRCFHPRLIRVENILQALLRRIEVNWLQYCNDDILSYLSGLLLHFHLCRLQ